ncbi:beta strand repeat-containing protein [Lactiplantibacillus pentosus]|uniref:beta strand repeat-containing protein n=1 Tax=Lactiplantibacillus pentosus TaxID=1589 RepID=UPI003C2F219C
MAESNATQVILTDDGIKIIKAQNTADNAAGGVTNLNDPNLMSVIEKQTQASQYAGLTSQYNVVLARAKDANVSTTDLTTAYTNLNTFMTAILTDTTKASDVNRDTYKSLTDAYNMALSNVQTALSNNFNTDMDNMQSSVSVASQAASSAVIVASQATVTGNSASQMASQAVVIASQAQSAGNNATSIANSASQAASSAVLAGSQATVSANKAITAASQAQSAGNNATSIANNASQAASSAILVGSQAAVSANKASADYQTLSAGVKDGSVVHITTETVIDKGVIGTAEIANGAITNAQIGNEAVNSAKIANLAVGTAQIGDGAITNAKIGSLAVGTAQVANGAITNSQIGSLAVDTTKIKDASITSAKIANLAVGTAQIGDGAITNAKIGKLAVGTAQIANAAITDAQVGNVSANKLTAGTIDFNTITGKNINASNITTGTLSTDRLNVGKLSALSANLGDVTTGSLKGVDIIANTFSTPNGSFTTDANGAVVASNLTIRGVTNLVYNAALLGNSGTYPNTKVPGWNLFTKGYYSNATLHDGVPSIGFNSSTGSGTWVTFAQSKLYPLNGLHGQPYSASVWFIDDGSEAAMKYQFTLAFFDANGNRLASGYAGNTWNGNPTAQGWTYKTIDNIISPSTAVYVGIQYWAYNGTGHALFSSPMLTQTAQSTGYQPDTGNVVSAGIIDGSTINGGTINMQTDGLINSPYNGIQQTADQFYHPWTLKTGQLTIGQGYITSVSSGTRSINGVPKQFDSLQGTLSASYLKFTNNYGARTYIDADMFTYSNQTNDTAMVAISASGIGINMGTRSAPALTISNGYIDASSSSSYGKFGAMTLGYNPHTINSDGSLFFESGLGSGNPGINIWAKGFRSLSSRLSTKRQVRLLDDEHSNSLLLGADTASFQYNQDTNADNSNEGVIIDDVNKDKQYSLPDELITRDGKAPTDLMSFIARVISQNKYQARLIEDLQIRLRKVEIKNEQ